jgi:hypothetical protein
VLIPSGSDLSLVWHRAWGGYNGATEFPYAFDANPAGQSPAQMAANNGVMYLVANDDDLATTYNTPALRAWVDDLFYLKTIPPGVNKVYSTHVYRLLPPQVTTNVTLGETIALVGYDLNTDEAAPGDVIVLRPYWRATAQPSSNYSMFVHLLAADNPAPITQFDGPPAAPERLTPTWTDPDETLIGTDAMLALPVDLPPGDYTLALGLYDFQTGARLPLADGDDAYTIPLTIR